MELPIAATPSEPAADVLIRYYQHTKRLWTEHLAEPTLLDCGTAYANKEMASLPEANCVLDAALPDEMSAAAAVEMVTRHYDEASCRCASWTMNVSADPLQTRPLIAQLIQNGLQPTCDVVMHLTRATVLPQCKPFQIIPARASFRHLQALAGERAAEANLPQLLEASLLHLDDPHWDSFLALDGTRAVGMGGVLIAGDIGRIDELYVSQEDRQRGIGQALMHRVLETCARSLLRNVLLGVEEKNQRAHSLFEKLGFKRVGEDTTLHMPRQH